MKEQHLVTKPTDEYALLDCGEGEKLEKYGSFVLTRPDPQALWPKTELSQWGKVDGRFTRNGTEGKWQKNPRLPKEWPVHLGGLTFAVKLTSFKHTGMFPEQVSNWEWAGERIRSAVGGGREVSVLNLFGYTGGATLAAAAAGAEVTHVDASKTAVAWARENAELSGLSGRPIHWIVEDAMLFVKRELRRGNTYDAIMLDPPAFGRGAKNEVWKIEEQFIELMAACRSLLSQQPLFMIASGYAAGYAPLAFAYNIEPLIGERGGEVQYGELLIAQKDSTRNLPCGIYARWSGN